MALSIIWAIPYHGSRFRRPPLVSEVRSHTASIGLTSSHHKNDITDRMMQIQGERNKLSFDSHKEVSCTHISSTSVCDSLGKET
jgi:hypothetical protein